MRTTLAALAMIALPGAALACTSAAGPSDDGLFEDAAAYEAFVDEKMRCIDLMGLMVGLFGEGSFNMVQMQANARTIQGLFPSKLTESATVRREDMAGGFFQEIRAYWIDGNRQAYWGYAFGQVREGGRINIMTMNVHTQPNGIFENWR